MFSIFIINCWKSPFAISMIKYPFWTFYFAGRKRLCLLHAHWNLQIWSSMQVSSSTTHSISTCFRLCKCRVTYNTCFTIPSRDSVLASTKDTICCQSSVARISSLHACHFLTFPSYAVNAKLE